MAALALVFAALTEGVLALTIATVISVAARDSGPDVAWAWFPAGALLGLGTAQVLTRGPLARMRGGRAAAAALLALLLRLALAGDLALWDLGWLAHFLHEGDFGSSNSGVYVGGLIVLTAAWGRGLSRGRDDPDLERLPRSLGPHFGLAVVLVLLAAIGDRAAPTGTAAAALFVTGIIALAASQLAQSGATIGEIRAGGIVGALLGLTLAATVGAAVLAWLVLDVTAPVIGPPLGKAVEVVFIVLFLPPAWLLERFFSLIGFGGGLSEEIQRAAEAAPPVAAGAGAEKDTADPAWRDWLAAGLRMLLLVAVAAGVYFGYRAATRFFGRRGAAPLAHEGTAPAGGLLADLRGLFHRPARGARESRGWQGPTARLYADVLARAESAGRSRAPAETPHELAPALRTTLAAPVTDEITAAFEEARYAGREPPPETVAALRARWEQANRPPRP